MSETIYSETFKNERFGDCVYTIERAADAADENLRTIRQYVLYLQNKKIMHLDTPREIADAWSIVNAAPARAARPVRDQNEALDVLTSHMRLYQSIIEKWSSEDDITINCEHISFMANSENTHQDPDTFLELHLSLIDVDSGGAWTCSNDDIDDEDNERELNLDCNATADEFYVTNVNSDTHTFDSLRAAVAYCDSTYAQ